MHSAAATHPGPLCVMMASSVSMGKFGGMLPTTRCLGIGCSYHVHLFSPRSIMHSAIISHKHNAGSPIYELLHHQDSISESTSTKPVTQDSSRMPQPLQHAHTGSQSRLNMHAHDALIKQQSSCKDDL